MYDATLNNTPDLTALQAALATLNHLAVDTLYRALKVYGHDKPWHRITAFLPRTADTDDCTGMCANWEDKQ